MVPLNSRARKATALLRLVLVIVGWLIAAASLSPALSQDQTAPAQGEKRIALIIGNGGYTAVTPLVNPPADARLMTATLEKVGFAVTTLVDADQAAMKRAIADFGRSLRASGPDTVALFYYAGHAVQSYGNNYLLPVDTAIRDQADLDLVGVEAGWVLRQLFSARARTNIVILDACRNNPFGDVAGFTDEGLAEMNAPTGSFLAYSTAPGSVALDGADGNSPYTSALAAQILAGPQSVELLFKNVRRKVLDLTGGRQTPWESSSLTSDFDFDPAPGGAPAAAAATPSVADDETMWASVRDSGDPVKIRLYLWAYPQGRHRAEAEAMLAAVAAPGADAGAAQADPQRVTFAGPLPSGDPGIIGRSIEELIKSEPHYPPFEGIPDELWKGQHCANCHQWTRDRICEQAQTYLTEEASRAMQKPHPLGVTFKQNLRNWAAAGCP